MIAIGRARILRTGSSNIHEDQEEKNSDFHRKGFVFINSVKPKFVTPTPALIQIIYYLQFTIIYIEDTLPMAHKN